MKILSKKIVKCKVCNLDLIRNSNSQKYHLNCFKEVIAKQINQKYRQNPERKVYLRLWWLNNKKKYKKDKLKLLEYHKKYNSLNKEKLKSRSLAIKYVKLKDNCQICGSAEKLNRHHWRYDKPLLISTLCSECHGIQHGGAFTLSRQ